MRRSVCNLAVRSAERSIVGENRASFNTSSCSSFCGRALASDSRSRRTQSRNSAQRESKVRASDPLFPIHQRRLSFLSGNFCPSFWDKIESVFSLQTNFCELIHFQSPSSIWFLNFIWTKKISSAEKVILCGQRNEFNNQHRALNSYEIFRL